MYLYASKFNTSVFDMSKKVSLTTLKFTKQSFIQIHKHFSYSKKIAKHFLTNININ